MISIDTIAPLVANEVPACPDPIVKWGIQMAAQDFFRDTELWRIECDPVVSVDEALVDLDIPNGTVVNAIYQLYANGVLLPAGRPDTAASQTDVWMTKTADDITEYWVSPPNQIRVYPINTVSATIYAHLSVVPGTGTTSYPEVTGDFLQTMVAGALWKLQSMAGKAWTNESAAATNGSLFNAAMIRAKINANRAGNSTMQVTMRAF